MKRQECEHMDATGHNNKKNLKPILKCAIAIIIIMAIGYGVGFATLSILRTKPQTENNKTNTVTNYIEVVEIEEVGNN